MTEQVIGVIGGSGLYEMEGLTGVEHVVVDTPFGKPSDEYITGTLEGVRLVFLPRHGKGHRFLPSEVNYRANIYGMKKLGVERIISVSAVGSMQGGDRSRPYRHSRPVHRPHQGDTERHLFRRGCCRPCPVRRSGLRRAVGETP